MSKLQLIAIILISFLFSGLKLSAQDKTFSGYITLGIASPILDNGYGIQASVNPNYRFAKHFGLEGQVAYLYNRVTGSFLNGEVSQENVYQTFLGTRVFFNPAGNFIWSMNLLGGAVQDNNGWNPGLALGAFVEKNSFVFGISAESSGFYLAKLGYHLGK